MGKIQDVFESNAGESFVLSPGEYEGPLTISRTCIVDGCNSTLWANSGPVLTISAPDVIVKNLRVEVTGCIENPESGIAIRSTTNNTQFENVEVRGKIVGVSQESELWNLPSVISLGNFAANKENTFAIQIQAPVQASLHSKVKDIRISQARIAPGQNSLALTTNELKDNTILYGDILVQTSVSRRIYVTGKAIDNAPVHNDTVSIPVITGPTVSLPDQMRVPRDVIAPQVSSADVRLLQRGQRISTKEFQSSQIKIVYEHKYAPSGLDIDSYCFMLKENGKVSCDEDLIFFGNTESVDHSVSSSSIDSKPMTIIDIEKVDSRLNRIAVCYSIYGDDNHQNFSMISDPMIRLFDGDKEVFRFEMKDLLEEKTVVALEIYRYKGEWKINFVGSGYKSGLKHLCEGFGVNVE